jgi:hypothetical protein
LNERVWFVCGSKSGPGSSTDNLIAEDAESVEKDSYGYLRVLNAFVSNPFLSIRVICAIADSFMEARYQHNGAEHIIRPEPAAGVVARLLVSAEDTVERGQELAELAPG